MVIYNNLYRKLIIVFSPCFTPSKDFFYLTFLALSIRACSLFKAMVAVFLVLYILMSFKGLL